MNKNVLYLTLKLLALAAVISEYFSTDSLGGWKIVGALVFCCLFTLDHLICRSGVKEPIKAVCAFAEIAGCFVCGVSEYFPLLVMFTFQIVDMFDTRKYFYIISALLTAFFVLIFRPEYQLTSAAVLLTASGFFSRSAIERLEYFRRLSENQRNTITAQNERIAKLSLWSNTLRETAAFEERSRFSTRIHDKLGHGISGSMILLEGAKLNIRKSPEQAERSIEIAIENLRGSVDSIREALHEERPKRSTVNVSELKEMLERFGVNYGLKTVFSIDGDAERVSPQIWVCLKENLTESLTNTVKHSNADKFTLNIRIYDKIIRADFSDNGSNSAGFSKGMGLEGIEDRVTVCGGKCLFQNGAAGFKVINIFGVEI